MAKKKELAYELSGKILTKKLHELARDVISSEIDDEGECKLETRAEVLARKVWDMATGATRTEDGTIEYKGNPVPWAVGLIFERLEGKVVPRAADTTTRPALGKRIDEQNKLKINALRPHE